MTNITELPSVLLSFGTSSPSPMSSVFQAEDAIPPFTSEEPNSTNLTNLTKMLSEEVFESVRGWEWLRTVKLLIFVPIVAFAIGGNFLALFSFITRHRQMKSPTHYFIANLALSDFLVGILCLPFLATQAITGKWYFGQEFCFAYIIMHFWFCSCSIYSTCAICVERYIGVRYPLSHKRIMSTPRVVFGILFIWIYGGIITSISIFAWPSEHYPSFIIVDKKDVEEDAGDCADSSSSLMEQYECRINERIEHVLFSTVFILYIPAAIMMVLYWRIYVLATKHLKVLRNPKFTHGRSCSIKWNNGEEVNTSDGGPPTLVTIESISFQSVEVEVEEKDKNEAVGGGTISQKPTGLWIPSIKRMRRLSLSGYRSGTTNSTETLVQATSSKKHINLAKRLCLLVGILLLSYLPYYTVFLIRALDPELISKDVFNVFKWIRYFNSAANPFFYAFAVPAYRKAFVNIVCRGKWLG